VKQEHFATRHTCCLEDQSLLLWQLVQPKEGCFMLLGSVKSFS